MSGPPRGHWPAEPVSALAEQPPPSALERFQARNRARRLRTRQEVSRVKYVLARVWGFESHTEALRTAREPLDGVDVMFFLPFAVLFLPALVPLHVLVAAWRGAAALARRFWYGEA